MLLQDNLSLKRALTDASSKAAGITPLLLAQALTDCEYVLLDTEVRWIERRPATEVRTVLTAVAADLVRGVVA